MTAPTRDEGIEAIRDIIKSIRIAMLITIDEQGRPKGRPMAIQQAPFDGTLWFFTAADSPKVADIVRNRRVNVSCASTSAESYLSMSGEAEVVNDRSMIHELWSPFLRPWFDSADDPSIRLLRVSVDEAEYWDTPGGKVASLLHLAKAVITGTEGSMGSNHQTVRL